MAEYAACILGPAVESALKSVGAAIKRQFIYLFCFSSNISGMKDEAKKLDETVQGVQAQVDAKNNVQRIHREVTSWLESSDKFKGEMNIILDEVPKVRSGCFTVPARFRLGKRAKKAAEAMAQHREMSNFEHISMPPTSSASKAIPLTSYEFSSRKKFEEEIMEALRDNSMIGIHGMGGLGKTTMAIRIMNRVLNEHVFDEAVMAVVSQSVDQLKIQHEIGEPLGLKGLKEESPQSRLQKLHARISAGTKRILIVLDDVWKPLKLEDLGIPCDCKGCTILITSRNRDALTAMNVQRVLGMEQLSEDDAWFMFREKAGASVDDTKVKSTVEEVVEMCRGLPIALATVGASLKDEKDVRIWKDALKQLKQPNPKNTPGYIKEVYNPLILSYDRLDNEEAKSVFLLFCLFPEDADIPLYYFTYFCIGLGIFEDMSSLEEGRGRMCTLIKSLTSRSFLFNSEHEDCVRMHDVVRDVCIFIAKQKGYIGDKYCTWISPCQLPREGLTLVPMGLMRFPNLRLLYTEHTDLIIDSTFFEGMRELYVLCINHYSLKAPPLVTHSLNNLRTLLLYACEGLETMLLAVGSLVNLEILMCRDCEDIEELPMEIGGLVHLKLLELTGCENLQRIAPGIISSLVGLEELKMLNSFKGWEAYEEEGWNAKLTELESLKYLTCLEIEIADPALASQEINLSTKIERFQIIFDCNKYDPEIVLHQSNKTLFISGLGENCLGHWIKKLLKDTEYLYFSGERGNDLDLANIPNIRSLKLEGCESMKNIVKPMDDDDDDDGRSAYTMFPQMECLQLEDLPQLQEIWNAPISSNSLQNLKKIQLAYLPALKHWWKSSTGTMSLPQLESLEIQRCKEMEQLFICSDDITEIQAIQFPRLTTISISKCPKMRSLIPIIADIDDHSLHLFCQPQKVSYGNLKYLNMDRNPFCHHNNIHASFFNELETLQISKYGGGMSLFTPSVARNLPNLIELIIYDCDEMGEVIEDDKGEDKIVSGGEGNLLFPKLQKLKLDNLGKLMSFCRWKCEVVLPLLKDVFIHECPNMINFTLPSIATPDLEYFSTDLNYYLHEVEVEAPFIENEKPSCSLHQIHVFSFKGLRTLSISRNRGSMSVCSSSIAENLVNLVSLYIENCKEMVTVIEEDERGGEGKGNTTLLFPKLWDLILHRLPKLKSFCQSDVELPSLVSLNIRGCPILRKFTTGSFIAPKLQSVFMDNKYCSIDATADLNETVEQHFCEFVSSPRDLMHACMQQQLK